MQQTDKRTRARLSSAYGFRYFFLAFICFVFFGLLFETNTAYALSPTKVTFPLPTNKVWRGSTYVGHGSYSSTLKSAMDITIPGESAEGYTVYAMASGKVIDRTDSEGRIVVKVSTPLITTNGAYIGSWFYCYAHMKNISVSAGSTIQAGQSVGQVSMVGKAEGPHLHVNIVSADYGGSIWDDAGTKYSISPYYVYGFVDASGNNTSYFTRDMSGPAVTEWLINHVPVSTSVMPDTSAPVVVSAEAKNITDTGFDVVCRITDDVGVTKTRFAVWNGGDTANDQDDLKWYEITSKTSGSAADGTWTCHVDISNHNNEYTDYYVDIYGYDAAGNFNNPNTHIAGIRVNPAISTITINYPGLLVLKRGETEQLTVTTDPAEFDKTKLRWTSSNDAIVSVNSAGLVTAHHLYDGVVTITCESPDGSVSDHINVSVSSNVSENSAFYVDRVSSSVGDGYEGLVALIREPGDMLEYAVGVYFENDVKTYDVEYTVEEGNIILSNGTLFIGKNTADKNVIAAHIYDVYDDGSRGCQMEAVKITIFKDIGGGIFTLPANLSTIGEYAFEGVAAKKYFIPSSLTALPFNSLAGLPCGSWIYFNSDTINPFYDYEVLGLPETEARSEDYVWFDTGSLSRVYYNGDGGTANYYCLKSPEEYHWSDWTTTTPSNGVEYETKTQYRSRSVFTETVYSAWSDWIPNGTTVVTSNDLCDVRPIPHAAQTKTVYTYKHYKYYNTSRNMWLYSYVDNSGNSWSTQGRWETVESDLPYTQYKWASSDGYDGWRDSSEIPWFDQRTKQVTVAEAYTEYQYRTRTASQQTTYGEWSNWSDTAIAATESIEVETRIVYRMKVYN